MASCRECYHCTTHTSIVYYVSLLQRYTTKLEGALCRVHEALLSPMDDVARATLAEELEKLLTDELKSPEDETVDAYRFRKED